MLQLTYLWRHNRKAQSPNCSGVSSYKYLTFEIKIYMIDTKEKEERNNKFNSFLLLFNQIEIFPGVSRKWEKCIAYKIR